MSIQQRQALIDPIVLQAVCFLYGQANTADAVPVPIGTGFFMTVMVKGEPRVVLVTARHLLTSKDGIRVAPLWMRVNRIGADPELIDLATSEVVLPDDSSADIAVVLTAPDQDRFDYRALKARDFLAERPMYRPPAFGLGSHVFFIGLLLANPGQERNEPVVRYGHVSGIPGGRILWTDDRFAELLLLETIANAGTSGAPVFADFGDLDPKTRNPTPRLLGVMRGQFTDPLDVDLSEEGPPSVSLRVRGAVNAGIAAVVPGYLLEDVLARVAGKLEDQA